ncbi:helix-turn-helix domain-containing protein [Nocardioides marinquilinus]|uniref:Helix-turn-helix domain-containing protein n=1 Tax=Nocardioides marinquilinus TaxID=1210400 RepID=A0ABP9PKV6_9ACTN
MDDETRLGSELVMYASRLVRAVRRELDLPAGVRIVSILDEHGPMGISALADADRSSQPTMSAAIGGLVASGWVEKRRHPTDARSSVVVLTDAGRAELTRVRRAYGESVAARASGRHTPAELATAVAVLRDVLEHPEHPENPDTQEGPRP